MEKIDILYVVSDLKRVGPTNQTLNIIKNSKYKNVSAVVKLFNEPEDSMIEEYKKNNIKIIELNLKRNNFVSESIKKIKEIVVNKQVKIIHSYGIKPDYISQKVAKKANIKHIITLRNFPKEDIYTRMPFWQANIAYFSHIKVLKQATHIIACSNTIKQKMEKKYKNINIMAIQNGVNTEKFYKTNENLKKELRKKYKLDEKEKIYISTSSFIPRKRIEETIMAFENLKMDNKKLLLLGDGLEYQKIFEKYKINEKIKFIGKTDKIVEYLQLSDIFLSSSESEGLPNGVIEAISCGIPVLISNIQQHLEIFKEIKYAGVSYELGNIEDFSNKMLKIIEYNNENCNIKLTELTMENMSKKYVEYYKKVLGENYES